MRMGIKGVGEEILSSVRQVDINEATSQMPRSDFGSEMEATNVKRNPAFLSVARFVGL